MNKNSRRLKSLHKLREKRKRSRSRSKGKLNPEYQNLIDRVKNIKEDTPVVKMN